MQGGPLLLLQQNQNARKSGILENFRDGGKRKSPGLERRL